jgi:hypothetical protein
MTQDRGARKRRGALAALALGGGIFVAIFVTACSLANVKADPCTGDAQCAAAFGAGSTCQQGYCTNPGGMTDCNTTGVDGRACYSCPPMTQAEFHTACTNASCQSFDNATRLTKLLPDGGLPPLP